MKRETNSSLKSFILFWWFPRIVYYRYYVAPVLNYLTFTFRMFQKIWTITLLVIAEGQHWPVSRVFLNPFFFQLVICWFWSVFQSHWPVFTTEVGSDQMQCNGDNKHKMMFTDFEPSFVAAKSIYRLVIVQLPFFQYAYWLIKSDSKFNFFCTFKKINPLMLINLNILSFFNIFIYSIIVYRLHIKY